MKNNKGVTLVELLVVIVVMGIIAGFAIPAVGNIIENANKDSVLNDAIQIENAAKLYCSTNNCPSGVTTLQYSDLEDFLDGFDDTAYAGENTTTPGTLDDGNETLQSSTATNIAYRDANGVWNVYLEAAGVDSGSWEFTNGAAPTAGTYTDPTSWISPSADSTTRDDITAD